jgi:hypothetical protein
VYGKLWENVLDQMGGGLGHAPGITGGTDPTSLAGESHQEVVTTFGTAGSGKPMGQDAALQIATELPFDVGRYRIVVPALTR